MRNVKFRFNKITYAYPRDKAALAIQVDKYSYNMAKKLTSCRHLPYEFAEELCGEFNVLFYDKILPKARKIECDVATYFNTCCTNYVSAILKSNVKKRSKGLADYDFDDKWCIKYTIHTTGSLLDQKDGDD